MEFKQREMREKESLQGPVTEKEITKITGGTDTAGKHRQHRPGVWQWTDLFIIIINNNII